MKRRFLLHGLLMIAIGGWLCGCKSNNNEKPDAQKILHAPPYAGLTDSIARFPNNEGLYLQRALLLSQNNLHELATPDYNKAWELKPDEGIALQYVSNLMLVDRPEEAIRLLKKCVATWPASPDLHRRLSEIYTQVGQTQNAVTQYDEWLQQDSTNFEAWHDKGLLLARLKDTANAIRSLERSYQLRPINYNGLPLASLYEATLNPKVLTICDELIAKDTTGILTDVLYLKGSYYSDSKQYAKAIRLFDECISHDWKFTDAYIEKGIVLYDEKIYDSALHVFIMAATVSNTSADAYYWMARCYEATGNREAALSNYERALVIDKNFEEARDGIRRLKR